MPSIHSDVTHNHFEVPANGRYSQPFGSRAGNSRHLRLKQLFRNRFVEAGRGLGSIRLQFMSDGQAGTWAGRGQVDENRPTHWVGDLAHKHGTPTNRQSGWH